MPFLSPNIIKQHCFGNLICCVGNIQGAKNILRELGVKKKLRSIPSIFWNEFKCSSEHVDSCNLKSRIVPYIRRNLKIIRMESTKSWTKSRRWYIQWVGRWKSRIALYQRVWIKVNICSALFFRNISWHSDVIIGASERQKSDERFRASFASISNAITFANE